MAELAEALREFQRRELTADGDLAADLERVYLPLATEVRAWRRAAGRMLVVGMCGAQGSGKSTLARVLCFLLEREGARAVTLSLDDLYLPWEARRRWQAAHPDDPYYQVSRGNPGTHDVALGVETLDRLGQAGPEDETRLPAFDKSRHDGKGDVLPRAEWPVVRGRPDVVFFEGWCVGMRPLDRANYERLLAGAPAAQAFAREHDRDGRYGWAVNERLADYAPLWDRLDRSIYLRVPSVAKIVEWRTKQERRLRATSGSGMSDAEVAAFIAPYLLLTEVHGLGAMTEVADLVLRLDDDQRPWVPSEGKNAGRL